MDQKGSKKGSEAALGAFWEPLWQQPRSGTLPELISQGLWADLASLGGGQTHILKALFDRCLRDLPPPTSSSLCIQVDEIEDARLCFFIALEIDFGMILVPF